MSVSPVAPRPPGPIVMRQQWRDLLFLHWAWEADAVQKTLPPGLTVDSYDGRAWVGIVPFFMANVRPSLLPAVPWLSTFLELNVRTYVRDEMGRPGVWFYSLDCNQPIAVWVARTFFKLPYFRAGMSADRAMDGTIAYRCRRHGTAIESEYRYAGLGSGEVGELGSLEEFLIERYRLFSERDGRLFTGQVWHQPYRIAPAKVIRLSRSPLEQAGFAGACEAPDHALFSPGVDVRVYALSRI